MPQASEELFLLASEDRDPRWSVNPDAASLGNITLYGQFHFQFPFVVIVVDTVFFCTRSFLGVLSVKLRFSLLRKVWRILRVERSFKKILSFLVEIILLLCTMQLFLSGGICLYSSLFSPFSGGLSKVLRQEHCRWIPPPLFFLLQNPEPGGFLRPPS